MIPRPQDDAFAFFERLGLPLRPTAPIERLINLLLAGNNGGFIDPAFGFCQFDSLASGIRPVE